MKSDRFSYIMQYISFIYDIYLIDYILYTITTYSIEQYKFYI